MGTIAHCRKHNSQYKIVDNPDGCPECIRKTQAPTTIEHVEFFCGTQKITLDLTCKNAQYLANALATLGYFGNIHDND